MCTSPWRTPSANLVVMNLSCNEFAFTRKCGGSSNTLTYHIPNKYFSTVTLAKRSQVRISVAGVERGGRGGTSFTY